MRVPLGLLAAIAFAACAATPTPVETLTIHSAQVGFTQIDVRATETRRNEQASVLEFEDLNPDQGSKLTKGVFQLRSAATVVARRGYRYFVILNKSSDDTGLLIGLLPARDADFGDVFGAQYAGLPREGILDADKLGPLTAP